MMRNFKYSWQQIAKASFIGIATTATFYLTKTTGLFSSWFSVEDSTDVIPRLDRGFQEQSIELSVISLDPAVKSRDDSSSVEINTAQRRLLQQNGVTIINPIPDQIIDATVAYRYDLSNVFSGNFSLIGTKTTQNLTLPSWLNLDCILGSYNTPGTAHSVFVEGELVYVADDANGFHMINISSLTTPSLMKSYGVGNTAYVVAQGSLAYVVTVGDLKIVNLSSTAFYPVIGNYTLGSIKQIILQWPLAYVTAASSGLYILNVSDPRNVIQVGRYDTSGDACSVEVQWPLAYVANGYKGIQILNISNPQNITSLGSCSTTTNAVDLKIQGAWAYVVTQSYLQIFNVSNPQNITQVSSYSLPGLGYSIVIQGTIAYVADGSGGLRVIDISIPTNPKLLCIHNLPDAVQDVVVQGALAYVATGLSGLQILDLTQCRLTGTPSITRVGETQLLEITAWQSGGLAASDNFQLTIDRLPTRVDTSLTDQSVFPGHSLSMNLDSDLLFTDPDSGILTLSASVQSLASSQIVPAPWLTLSMLPTFVGSYNNVAFSIGAYAVKVQGGIVYLGYETGLLIIDVSIPSTPVLLGRTSSAVVTQVEIQGALAYLALPSLGLQIFNVSVLSNPVLVGTFASSGVQDVAVQGSLVYLANSFTGLQIVNASNPFNPVLTGNYTMDFPLGLKVQGPLVYVANLLFPQLRIVNVSIPTNPILVGTYGSPASAHGLSVRGALTYMAGTTSGLEIVNVTTPSNPRFVGRYDTPDTAQRVVVQGALAYVADSISGLQIIDVSKPSFPSHTGSYQVPGQAFDVAVQGTLGYIAYGMSGLQIVDLTKWQLIATPTAADVGNYKVTITATDELGGSASADFQLRVEGLPRFNGNISTQYAKIGQAFNYFVPQGLVTDPNFDAVVFTAKLSNGQALPSWLSFNAISATFAGTPSSSAVGNNTILLSVTDNIAGSVNTTFLLRVSHAPVVSQRIPDQAMSLGRNNSVLVPPGTFTHADNLPLIYSAKRSNGLALPTWLLFNNMSALFTGQPNITDAGVLSLQVTADDQAGGQVSTPLTLYVENFPRIAQPITTQGAGVGMIYRLSVANSFVDDDGDLMTYQAVQSDGSSLPSWLSFNAFGLEFSGTPASSDLEMFTIRFSATDSLGGRTDQLFNMTVSYFPTVGAPIISQVGCVAQSYQMVIPSNTFLAGGASFTYAAQQSNGQALPAWLSLDGMAGIFSGLPAASDTGQAVIALTGNAVSGGSASTDFSLLVTTCPALRNPVASRVTNVNAPFALTLAGDTFDNGGMTLSFSAERTDHSALPNWLTFNPVSGVLGGVPLSSDVKLEALQFVARNPYGGQAVAPFNVTVCYFPNWVTPLPTSLSLRSERAFAFTIPAGTFISPTGATLQYQALRSDGSALPSWLSFNASQHTLFGTPGLTDLGNMNVQVIASDPSCGSTAAPLSLVVLQNYPPEVVQPLSNQIASVNTHFTFFAPADTFTDRNNDTLSYTAAQSSGQSLPGWLHFTAATLSFSGTPDRGDTDYFSDKVLTIALTAHDDKSQTSANFNINVRGTSNLFLFIKIAAPIFSILTAGLALYSQRGRLLNRCREKRYQRLDEQQVIIGDEFKYQFETPRSQVKAVRVRIAKETKSCCGFFQVPRQALPGGVNLPDWMQYDPETNTLSSRGPVRATRFKELFVQVKGTGQQTLEQFTLRIVQPELLHQTTATQHIGDGDVEMQPLPPPPETQSMSF